MAIQAHQPAIREAEAAVPAAQDHYPMADQEERAALPVQ
jgi:hypothetical protein